MPYQTQYDRERRHITYRFWGNLSQEEFAAATDPQGEFFREMSGLVTILIDVRGLHDVPTSILTQGRILYRTHYRPLVIAFAGASPFVRSIADTFARITKVEIQHFATPQEAENFLAQRRRQGQ